MTDPIDINRRSWDGRAVIHARDTTGSYPLDRFRAGESALHGTEATRLPDGHPRVPLSFSVKAKRGM